MTQRSIETIVGKLITDEEFRRDFQRDPVQALRSLIERGGADLTRAEMLALVEMDAAFWERVADEVDPRLQKASLKS